MYQSLPPFPCLQIQTQKKNMPMKNRARSCGKVTGVNIAKSLLVTVNTIGRCVMFVGTKSSFKKGWVGRGCGRAGWVDVAATIMARWQEVRAYRAYFLVLVFIGFEEGSDGKLREVHRLKQIKFGDLREVPEWKDEKEEEIARQEMDAALVVEPSRKKIWRWR